MEMNWKSIDTTEELSILDQSICWDDSQTLEYYASSRNEDYFPDDISRSGWHHKNIFVLCETDSSQGSFLELVFISSEWYGAWFMENIQLSGHVDTMKRVMIINQNGSTIMQCCRLIYRFLSEVEAESFRYGRIDMRAEQEYGASSY